MMASSSGSFPLSTELIIHIFCQLPLLSDVFALAATCSQLRDICSAYTNSIYIEVAPRSIACLYHARRFLADQGGPALGAPMAMKDLVRMARNADVVEKAILQFEREVVCNVRSGYRSRRGYRSAGARSHPPTLTRTERPRYISSYYTLWSMLKLNMLVWDSRLEQMTLNQLYSLHEMTNLTQSIGGEEAIPDCKTFPIKCPVNCGRSQKRITLGQRAWQQIQDISERILKKDALNPRDDAQFYGFKWFVVMWDHYQNTLKRSVTYFFRSAMQPSLDDQKRYLWNDDPEE